MSDKLLSKLEILADAAKYDASCSSGSGGKRAAGKSDSKEGDWFADGGFVSLLKILMTNNCMGLA